MNFNNYTQKSLEAVQDAQSIARSCNHQQMEQLHLLLALLRQDGGLIPQLLRKMDVTVESLEAAAQAELKKIPGVTGSREADKFYITADVDNTFTAAEEQAKHWSYSIFPVFSSSRRKPSAKPSLISVCTVV